MVSLEQPSSLLAAGVAGARRSLMRGRRGRPWCQWRPGELAKRFPEGVPNARYMYAPTHVAWQTRRLNSLNSLNSRSRRTARILRFSGTFGGYSLMAKFAVMQRRPSCLTTSGRQTWTRGESSAIWRHGSWEHTLDFDEYVLCLQMLPEGHADRHWCPRAREGKFTVGAIRIRDVDAQPDGQVVEPAARAVKSRAR